jgi:hypothetical protein
MYKIRSSAEIRNCGGRTPDDLPDLRRADAALQYNVPSRAVVSARTPSCAFFIWNFP